MIKFFRSLFIIACLTCSFTVFAQTTTNSPYSQYGLGNLQESILPQYRAMGGITAGMRNVGSVYDNINLANPASYSGIRLTTFDIGAGGVVTQMSKTGISRNSFNASLSHVVLAIPLTSKSAFSFGIVPYSDLGYQFKVSGKVTNDTTDVSYTYSGDGGMSKAYIGFGRSLGKHLSLGFNMGYLFGRLNHNSSTEFPADVVALNSRVLKSSSIRGLSLDFGTQYYTNISAKTILTIGYSLTAGNKLNGSTNTVGTHYAKDFTTGDESSAIDTVIYDQGIGYKVTMPTTQTIGFVLAGQNKWLVGADFSMSNWSVYREGNVNPGLQNSYKVAVGAQFTPNINAISNYFSLVDYRIGFKHNKTYININNTDINQTSLTMGLGLPLPANRSTFYKINFSAELGQRGSLSNSLVRERFVNLNLGFLLNDKWFYRPKLD
jgi:hypothetical protein